MKEFETFNNNYTVLEYGNWYFTNYIFFKKSIRFRQKYLNGSYWVATSFLNRKADIVNIWQTENGNANFLVHLFIAG